MKIWTVTVNDDNGLETFVFESEEKARSFTTGWVEDYGPYTLEELYGQPGFMDGIQLREHDLSHYPAIREARVTLHAVRERLEMNNFDGEEDPFIEDVDTALEMLK